MTYQLLRRRTPLTSSVASLDVGTRLTKAVVGGPAGRIWTDTSELIREPGMITSALCKTGSGGRLLYRVPVGFESLSAVLLSMRDWNVHCIDEDKAELAAGLHAHADTRSKSDRTTLCHVDLGADAVRATVFMDGAVVDRSCLGIGSEFMTLSDANVLLALSDSGETFLDGVAKAAPIGGKLEADKLELFCMLLGEVIAHFLKDKRPPQLTQRLLNTEKLRQEYAITHYTFSGGIFAVPPESSFPVAAVLRTCVAASMDERDLSWSVCEEPLFATALGMLQLEI